MFSAWLWGLLCRLGDVGAMDSKAVSVVRCTDSETRSSSERSGEASSGCGDSFWRSAWLLSFCIIGHWRLAGRRYGLEAWLATARIVVYCHQNCGRSPWHLSASSDGGISGVAFISRKGNGDKFSPKTKNTVRSSQPI
jgi:hypothetical protein